MGESLFTGSCSGVFFAFDKANGDVRWAYDTATDGYSASFHGEPIVTDELIVVGSDTATGEEAEGAVVPDGFVYAFELATGKARWSFSRNSRQNAAITVFLPLTASTRPTSSATSLSYSAMRL